MNTVYIFSRISILSKLLTERFTSVGVSSQVVNERLNTNEISGADYGIFIFDTLDEEKLDQVDNLISNYLKISKYLYKCTFLFPLTEKPEVVTKINEWRQKIFESKKELSSVVLLGDPVLHGEPVDFAELSRIYFNKTKNNGYFYPVDIYWAVKKLSEIALSMKAYGRTTAMSGGRHMIGSGLQDIQNVSYEDLEMCPNKIVIKQSPNIVDVNNQFNNPKNTKISIEEPIKKKPKIGFKLLKINVRKVVFYVCILLLLASIIVFWPLMLNLFSFGLLKLSSATYFKSQPSVSQSLSNVSQLFSKNAFNVSEKRFTKGFLPGYYKTQAKQSQKILATATLINTTVKTNTEGLILVREALKDNLNWIDISNFSSGIKLLEANYGFLQADGENLKFATKFETTLPENIELYRQKLISYVNILNKSSELLGKNETKTYLVAITDSKALGASGGEIKAVAVLSIREGKVLKLDVYNVEYLNNKLNGKVDAPSGFLKGDSKKNWNISAINWYSEFSDTARSLEWFAEKTINVNADGVFAISSKAVEEVLNTNTSSLGVNLATFGGDNQFTNNLKKSLTTLGNSENYNNSRLLLKIQELLNQKELLIYFNNVVVQNNVSSLGWDSSLSAYKCSGSCFSDFVGEIELPDTLGIENIQKETNINVSIEQGIVKKRVTIYFKNLNDIDYMSAVRVAGMLDSSFSPTVMITKSEKKEISGDIEVTTDYKVDEVKINIKPNEIVGISFYFETPIQQEVKNYQLKLIKQPGVVASDVGIKIDVPGELLNTNLLESSLTEEGSVLYNTKLSADQNIKVSWK